MAKDHGKWTIENEKEFIDNLGTYSLRGVYLSYPEWLKKYIQANELRKNPPWMYKAVGYAEDLLKEMEKCQPST